MSDAWSERYEGVGDLFRVLSSPVRVAIVDLLAGEAMFVHQIVATSGLSQPHVSQQLRILRDAGLVRRVRQGREVVYTLRDDVWLEDYVCGEPHRSLSSVAGVRRP